MSYFAKLKQLSIVTLLLVVVVVPGVTANDVYSINFEQSSTPSDSFFAAHDKQAIISDPYCKASLAMDADGLFCGYYGSIDLPNKDAASGLILNQFINLKFDSNVVNKTVSNLNL